MKFSEVQLPSNRRFGFLFSFIFLAIGIYFLYSQTSKVGLSFVVLSFFIGIVSIYKEDLLLPFNKVWMRFGFTLGLIISPIILGILFFILLTPVALITRSLGRDELRLKRVGGHTYWRQRNMNRSIKDSFRYQF